MNEYLQDPKDQVYYLIKPKGKKKGKQMIILDDPRDDTSDPDVPYQEVNLRTFISPSSGKVIKATKGIKNGRNYTLPPQPIGPVMIRKTRKARPVIVSEPVRKQNIFVPNVTKKRKKKVVRYRKLRRMDIRKSRLEEEYNKAKEHLDNLRIALQVYDTLDNQDQQKLADNVIYHSHFGKNIPQRRIKPNRRNLKLRNYDIEEYGEDYDEIDNYEEVAMHDAYGPMYTRNSHRLKPLLQRAESTQGNPSLSIFSPQRYQKKAFVPQHVDSDSDSSQVFMYDEEENAKESQCTEDDKSIQSQKIETRPVVTLRSGNPTNSMQSGRKNLPPSEEIIPVNESHDEDLDEDDEEDEDGAPFTQKFNESLDQDKIGQETIFQEINFLIQHFKENLGFLFVILRELRKISSYETRLACLRFFETIKFSNQETVSGRSRKFDVSKKSSIERSHKEKQKKTKTESSESFESDQSESSQEISTSTETPHPPTISEIKKIAQPIPDEETSEEDDDDDEVETNSNVDASNEDETEFEDVEVSLDEKTDISETSESDIDSQTAKSKDLLELLNLKLISLVYDRHTTKQNYSSKFLTQLSRDILLTISRHVPTATVELLESVHESIMNYSNQNIISCRDDLIQDVLDMLYDETIFNKLVSNVDSAYKEDIAAMKNRLNSLKKQRKNDIEKLKNDRLARLRAGNPYPHYLMQPSSGIAPQPVSPSQRFRQFSPKNSPSESTSQNLFDTLDQTHQETADRPSSFVRGYENIDSHYNNYEREESESPIQKTTIPNQSSITNSETKQNMNSIIEISDLNKVNQSQNSKKSDHIKISKRNASLNFSNYDSSVLSFEGIDGYSEISNQAVFDISSEFDINDVEDPIELANQVLHREELRRSFSSNSSRNNDYITIDDLPQLDVTTSDASTLVNSREILEQPMLVSPDEEEDPLVSELPKPNSQLYQEEKPTSQFNILSTTKDWSNAEVVPSLINLDLKAYSEELGNNAELVSDDIPTPNQHQSFSANSQELNSRFVEEFGKSLQKLTSKYSYKRSE